MARCPRTCSGSTATTPVRLLLLAAAASAGVSGAATTTAASPVAAESDEQVWWQLKALDTGETLPKAVLEEPSPSRRDANTTTPASGKGLGKVPVFGTVRKRGSRRTTPLADRPMLHVAIVDEPGG